MDDSLYKSIRSLVIAFLIGSAVSGILHPTNAGENVRRDICMHSGGHDSAACAYNFSE